MVPLSLYIHIPWCIQKCPYCDFNSHKSPSQLPESNYIQALLEDLDADLTRTSERLISSVFIGGGTPSLFSALAYETLFNGLTQRLTFEKNLEITLEANPGTVDYARFKDYRSLGINRLSLGIQSFNPAHLKTLGRIHNDEQAHVAIQKAREAGFDNLNLDLMHGLPKQSMEEGLLDLTTALQYEPEHLSWYQLTIEPNTMFYKTKPRLPSEKTAADLEEKGFDYLKAHQYERYEISAFCKNQNYARHNLNYWNFGDYLGLGAGAHGKLTNGTDITRIHKHRMPKAYLSHHEKNAGITTLSEADKLFEFMLNATRLEAPIPFSRFETRTGLSMNLLLPLLNQAKNKGLLHLNDDHWQITQHGRRFTNDLQAIFLIT
ncbi:MAG: radical SAM family heme chaperone HemW [Legionellaceae bacterium]